MWQAILVVAAMGYGECDDLPSNQESWVQRVMETDDEEEDGVQAAQMCQRRESHVKRVDQGAQASAMSKAEMCLVKVGRGVQALAMSKA